MTTSMRTVSPMRSVPSLPPGPGGGRPGRAVSDSTMTYPAGQPARSLQVESPGPQVNKTFVGHDGSVRLLSAGKGSDLVFKNLASGATYALGERSGEWTRIDASGSTRITLTGHNVVIYFPTDVPAGPSTTLVVGREDIAVDLCGVQFHSPLPERGNDRHLRCVELSWLVHLQLHRPHAPDPVLSATSAARRPRSTAGGPASSATHNPSQRTA